MKQSLFASLILASLVSVHAQDTQDSQEAQAQSLSLESLQESLSTLKADLDGHKEGYLETKNTVDKLAKFKISGYTQFQYRYAMDTVANSLFPIGDFAGGNINSSAGSNNVNGIFAVRRGRLKVSYKEALSSAQAEFEILPSGVSLKDLEFAVIDPWTKSIGGRVGVMDRPFGYEVGYSSSNLEIAERSRVVQTLFPGEKDLGAQIFWEADDNAPELLQHITLNGGLYSGFGGTSVNWADKKDFIGRVGFKAPMQDWGLNVDGGFSYYKGVVRNTATDSSYSLVNKAWTLKTSSSFDMDAHDFDRKYMGFDAQAMYDVPFVGGLVLRGEYISGKQPGTASASTSPSAGPVGPGTATFANPTPANVPTYERNFAGYYGQATLNVGPMVQLAYRYDMYDPNTDVKEADFVAGSTLKTSDLAYTTNSLGLSVFLNANTKVAVYYDMVANEKVASTVYATDGKTVSKAAVGTVTTTDSKGVKTIRTPFTRDLPDNVLNIRLQYKF